MPRTARASVGGVCYHVLNRGNNRDEVFFNDGDYGAFLKAIGHACVEVPMDVFAYCLMPNHFHLVLRPREDGDLSRWMHWLLNAHVRRYHKHHGRSGHLWQGRFKAFPIEEDEHLLTVLRYVERNPVRAKLVRRAENWLWSSAPFWKDEPVGERPSWLADPPIARGKDWLSRVNAALTAGELATVRKSVERGTPLGNPTWQQATAIRLGLESTLRKRGRPPKPKEPPENE
ncbi:MAG: transposase [Gemmataceae bacterium]